MISNPLDDYPEDDTPPKKDANFFMESTPKYKNSKFRDLLLGTSNMIWRDMNRTNPNDERRD